MLTGPDTGLGALLQVALGLAVGAYGAIVGAGGGFLLTPALLLLHAEMTVVTVGTLSLAAVAMNALSSAIAYARLGRIDYRTGLLLAIAGLPGTVAGVGLARLIPRTAFDVGFGVLLLGVAAFIILRPAVSPLPRSPRPGWVQRTMVTHAGVCFSYTYALPPAIAIGLVAGLISSLTGIGGGVLIVPALVILLHIPIEIAAPTSVFTIVFSALIGTAAHVLAGDFTFGPEQILFIGSGMILGGQIGVRLADHLPRGVIIRMLAVVVMILGLRLVLGHLPAFSG